MRADELIGGVSGVLLVLLVVRSSLGGGVAAPGIVAASGANVVPAPVEQRPATRCNQVLLPEDGAIRVTPLKLENRGHSVISQLNWTKLLLSVM